MPSGVAPATINKALCHEIRNLADNSTTDCIGSLAKGMETPAWMLSVVLVSGVDAYFDHISQNSCIALWGIAFRQTAISERTTLAGQSVGNTAAVDILCILAGGQYKSAGRDESGDEKS